MRSEGDAPEPERRDDPQPAPPGDAEPERAHDSGPERPAGGPYQLHPAAIAVSAVDSLREAIVPLAVIGGITVLGGGVDASALLRLAIYGALATAFAAAVGFVKWRTTRYSLEDDSISMRRGLLQKQQTAVPLERISSIDTVRGPVHRVLGTIELQVQAAGGGQEPEIRLQALSTEAAAQVRGHAARRADAPASGERSSTTAPLRRLSRRELALAAVTSGQFTVIVPILAALSQSFDDLIGNDEGAVGRFFVPDSLQTALVGIAILLVLAWLLAIAGTVVAFAGFTITRDGDRLRIERGLIQRRVSTIPVARIQAVRVVDGLLRQPLGLASIRVESAGYATERSVNTTLFPVIPRRELDEFIRTAVPELAAPLEPLEAPPSRAAWLYVGSPTLLGAIVAVPLAVLLSPLALLIVPLAAGVGALRLRAAGWRLSDDFLVVRSRMLARSTIVAPGRRLPERALGQGPVARRLGLATLAFALASRSRWSVPHIDEEVVRRLLGDLRPRPTGRGASAARAPDTRSAAARAG
jgi:putative membrane protein